MTIDQCVRSNCWREWLGIIDTASVIVFESKIALFSHNLVYTIPLCNGSCSASLSSSPVCRHLSPSELASLDTYRRSAGWFESLASHADHQLESYSERPRQP